MAENLKYTYSPDGGIVWVVRRWDYTEGGASGTKVSEHYTQDDAKTEAARLNDEYKRHSAGDFESPAE